MMVAETMGEGLVSPAMTTGGARGGIGRISSPSGAGWWHGAPLASRAGSGSRRRRRVTVVGVGVLVAATLAACSSTNSSAPRALLVGSFDGHKGQYATIQAAVDAAKPGDTILIGPGDYHADDDIEHPPTPKQAALGDFGGVLVHTPDLWIRGMNRNTVIVDGTRPGAPKPCDSAPQWQQPGPKDPKGGYYGTNGIVVFQANDVWIQNLTVCNFLDGNGSAGNGVWWDGGSETGKIGLTGYWGSYLTATTTYYGNPTEGPAYGIFANSAAGPAGWSHIYASNFDDSGMYVGACQQVCDIDIAGAVMQYNALGYSGTNSGGAVVIEDSTFSHNQDGFDTNTQIYSDPPPPQDGRCPHGAISPITHTRSCWVFMHDTVEDNNDAHAPIAPGGYASAGPVGTGMTVSGGRYDTVMDNTFVGNDAWGILFVPFPDHDKPFPGVTCANSGGHEVSGFGCVYDPEGDALLDNVFAANGAFGNPTNGDYGQITLFGGEPQNCFAGNSAPDGATPATLELTQPTCGRTTTAADTGGALFDQVLCDTGVGSCPADAHYPKPSPSDVELHPLPTDLRSMPNPCAGAPPNAWCRNGRPI
jgi:hypothetical protein